MSSNHVLYGTVACGHAPFTRAVGTVGNAQDSPGMCSCSDMCFNDMRSIGTCGMSTVPYGTVPYGTCVLWNIHIYIYI